MGDEDTTVGLGPRPPAPSAGGLAAADSRDGSRGDAELARLVAERVYILLRQDLETELDRRRPGVR
jgi:hypothetical protein